MARSICCLVVFLLWAAPAAAQVAPGPAVLPVDQVLKDPDRYDGQTIRVAGLLHLQFEGTHVVSALNLKTSRSTDRMPVDLSPFVFRDGFAYPAPVCDCPVVVEGLFRADPRRPNAVLPRMGEMEKVRIIEGGPVR